MPPDDEGRPGKGGPVAIPDKVIDTYVSTASDVVAFTTAQLLPKTEQADLPVDEVVDDLDVLAARVHTEFRRCRDAVVDAVEAQFAIGRCLEEARTQMPSDPEFGQWFHAQQFGFSQQWARVLRAAAVHEPDTRALLQSQLCSGRAPNIEKAVKRVRAALGDGRDQRPGLTPVQDGEPSEFPTIVIDPPWRYSNVATRGAAEDHYPTMTIDELAELELQAAANAHLYMWVTNGFLREGFHLMDRWGFTYKTTLTWCKPQMGMGNWFRNTTEHVLFGVRGSQPTLRNDVPTHFVADRTCHSTKPDSFYDLVESCSPAPRRDMFTRQRRLGWYRWGNES